MKKFFYSLLLIASVAVLGSCEYNDTEVWDAIDDANSRISALEASASKLNSDLLALTQIVNAMSDNISITRVDKTDNGFTIYFSNGTSATISSGTDGVNAPEISIKLDDDGNYYWTSNGDWIIVNGNKVKANGQDATAPQIRVNPDTNEWEISVDNGKTWSTTGVKATGIEGDSFFLSVDSSHPDYVEFILKDGTTFRVAKYGAKIFEVTDDDGNDISEVPQAIKLGTTAIYEVESTEIIAVDIENPEGWEVNLIDDKLIVTAPSSINESVETEGEVKITLTLPASGRSVEFVQYAIFRFTVYVPYELRVLTFEDDDVMFNPFILNRNDKDFKITKWSDLIDDKEYNGDLLYGGYMTNYEAPNPYWWYDENNTFLKHTMIDSWGYVYWNGGHAISNYASTDINGTGSFVNQLTIYGTKGSAGHNGSSNFAVHNGYIDDSGFSFSNQLPSFEFGDGQERIIDHMWVMPNNYALNCYYDGNGLTDKIKSGDNVKIYATGFDKNGVKGKTTEIFLCDGPEYIVKEWIKFDLSVLGAVARVEFNILGTSNNGYGFSQPAYFAYDDVAVRFY